MHFTKRLNIIFREHISCCAVSHHIYISPNKVVHCRIGFVHIPNSSKSENTSETGEKGVRANSLPIQSQLSPRGSRVQRVPFPWKPEHVSRPADPDSASDPDRALAALCVSTRGAHMRVRVCARERASAGQCVHSRYRLTHARACSTRRSTTPAALTSRRRPAATISPLHNRRIS